jgi:hypothetical protein
MDEALRYPLRGEHAEKTLLVAWLCVLVHALIVPFLALVPLAGYLVSMFAAAPDPEPPSALDRYVLSRGVGAVGLGIAYLAVPVIAAGVTFRLLLETTQAPTGGDAVVVLAGSTAVLFTLALSGYLLPIGIANYARTGSLRSGFTGLGDPAGHAAYFVSWCSGTVALLFAVATASALVDLGGIALVCGSFVGAYGALVATRRIARGYVAAIR